MQPREKNGRFASLGGMTSKVTRRMVTKVIRPQVPPTNKVAILIDESGSMSSFKKPVVDNFNLQINKLRQDALDLGQNTYVSFYKFNNKVTTVFDNKHINAVQPLSSGEYDPIGTTALRDALGTAIQDLGTPSAKESCLVLLLTDGLENASHQYGEAALKMLMKTQVATDRWTFAGICPPQYKNQLLALGFYEGNIQPWDTSKGEEGYRQVMTASVGATRSYMDARTKGVNSTKTFFTDLGAITPMDLKKSASIVTREFTKYEVTKESEIKIFVEDKTSKPYFAGMTLYELTKKEKLLYGRELVIEDKKTGVLYGGPEVRDLLQLPKFGDIKIDPLNHSHYRVYCQSTSNNRKLVRGSYILIRK